MAFSFKLPKKAASSADHHLDDLVTQSASIAPPPSIIVDNFSSGRKELVLPKIPLPKFLLEKTIEEQMKILGGIFVALIFVLIVLVLNDNRKTTNGTAYLAGAGELRMLSQRLAKASSLAAQGNAIAFSQLKESQAGFAELIERLQKGGV
ncbi:MAG TPA: type IV pili methyl-accepting chemotaxis transducer N-terminal domain-containing protein, partial [Rhodocyclaceae bacterium]|nr:type IV pili methyl-accepting chemotaxis transducer N-terminal domain-containing protein [Rhodocyclaceae bacterium]